MTEEATPKDEFLDMPESLRPVAVKHGRKLVWLALRLHALNGAVDAVVTYSQQRKQWAGHAQVLTNGLSELAGRIMDLEAHTPDAVAECVGDIVKAQLEAPRLICPGRLQ